MAGPPVASIHPGVRRRAMARRLRDVWLWLRAYVDLGLVDYRLRRRGFQEVVRTTESARKAGNGRTAKAGLRRARRYARRIAQAARIHPAPARCLHQSLVLHSWLCREGFPSELKIGVAKVGSTLQAHAWVELDGHVVNDRRLGVAAFTPLVDGESALFSQFPSDVCSPEGDSPILGRRRISETSQPSAHITDTTP